MKNLLALLAFTTFAVSANAAMSTSQLNAFKDSIKQGCLNRGLQLGDKNAASFCSCMDKVLRANLSDGDFEELAKLSVVGKGPGDMPRMKGLLPKLQACTGDRDT